MKLSVIFLTWNSIGFIPNCLNSLLEQMPSDTEIIIIDNGSTDGSKELIQKQYPSVNLVCNKQNRGVAPARNQGLRIAKGEYLLILDIDMVLMPGAINTLIQGMEQDDYVGLSGAKLISIEGKLQYTCRHFPTILSKFYRQLPPNVQTRFLESEELLSWDHSKSLYVGYVIGACQMIRRRALEQVGLYDERIFYGPEDVDYCLRMWKYGWKVLYNPNAVISHLERRITRKQPLRNPLFWIHMKGLLWYFWKHKYLFRRPKFEKINEFPATSPN